MDEEKKVKGSGRDRRETGSAGRRGLYRSLLVEFLMVTLGVFLALVANQWSEDRAHRKRAGKALRHIEMELRANRKALSLFHENNRAVLADMAEEGVGKGGGAAGRKKNFTPALQLSDSSWNALLSTGTADYLEFDTLRELSSVYAVQAVYRKSALLLVEAGLNLSAYAVAAGKAVPEGAFREEFMDYMEMIFEIEDKLLEAYGKALETVAPSPRDAAPGAPGLPP